MRDKTFTETQWWAWLGVCLWAGNVAAGLTMVYQHHWFTSLIGFGVAIYIAPSVWGNRRNL